VALALALALAVTRTLSLAQTSALALLRLSALALTWVLALASRAESETQPNEFNLKPMGTRLCCPQSLAVIQTLFLAEASSLAPALLRASNFSSGSVLALALAVTFHLHLPLPPFRGLYIMTFLPTPCYIRQWENGSHSTSLRKTLVLFLCNANRQIIANSSLYRL